MVTCRIAAHRFVLSNQAFSAVLVRSVYVDTLEVDSPNENHIPNNSMEQSDYAVSMSTCMGNTVGLHLEVETSIAYVENNEQEFLANVASLWQATENASRNPVSTHSL